MVHTKGAENKPTLSVTERLQRANARLTKLQEAIRAKKAEIEELKREEKGEAQQAIVKAIEESGKIAEEALAMIQRQQTGGGSDVCVEKQTGKRCAIKREQKKAPTVTMKTVTAGDF